MEIKNIATNIFKLEDDSPCKCGGEHQVCLSCQKCRAKNNSTLHTPLSTLAQYIDHTVLKADTTTADIVNLCEEAIKYQFKSVCINPSFIKTAVQVIKGNAPLLCTVVGFPLGANDTLIKLNETQQAIADGAKEIDMVIHIGKLREISNGSNVNDAVNYLLNEISLLANTCHQNDTILKVIIETCLLTREEIIIACLISKKAGADFVKTSTGFSIRGAVAENVQLMRAVVGDKVGIKASGGIKTYADAMIMIEAGANRIGTSASVKIVEENI